MKKGGNNMKKLGLAVLAALIFFVNGNLTFAQSLNYHASELMDLAEYLFPQVLAPAPQITKWDQADMAFYRSYSDTGIVLKAMDNHLYIYDQGKWDDLGMIDEYLLPLAQAEILFNLAETFYPTFLAPAPQATQVSGEILYRAYPKTNTAIGTFEKDLYFLDAQGQLHLIGRVDHLLDENLNFREVLAGVYTIQQKYTGRYVDAYVWESQDYQLVTREAQNDDTQKWIITSVPEEEMTFRGIAYDLDEAEISPPELVVVGNQTLTNNSPLEQTMSFAVNQTIQETSSFQRTVGIEVQVGRELEVSIPFLTASGSISITTGIEWTTGKSVTRSDSFTATFPVTVEPYGVYTATASVSKSTLSVPYVMFFESNETGAIRESRGTWSGVAYWGLDYEVRK